MVKKILLAALVLTAAIIISYAGFRTYVLSAPENCTACHYMKPFYDNWRESSHNGISCTKCHDYSFINSFTGQIRLSLGVSAPRLYAVIPDENCMQGGCHETRLKDSKIVFTKRNIIFDHLPHFTNELYGMKLHCRSCHYELVQGTHVKASKSVCFACHFKAGSGSLPDIGCPSCHSAPETPIELGGGKQFMHRDVLRKGVTCDRCHISTTRGDGSVAVERCAACHPGRTGIGDDPAALHVRHVGKLQLNCIDCHEEIVHGRIDVQFRPPKSTGN